MGIIMERNIIEDVLEDAQMYGKEQEIAALKAQLTLQRESFEMVVASQLEMIKHLKSQLSKQGWQDIKDAPRNGTGFDCLGEYGDRFPDCYFVGETLYQTDTYGDQRFLMADAMVRFKLITLPQESV